MKRVLTTRTLDLLPAGSRVAVIRLRSLGDCILSTPAIHLLKEARPDLTIGVVVEERFAPVFQDNPEIGFVLSPGIRELRSFAPDLCLNLHGGTRSARLTMLSGAKYRAGFDIFKPSFAYNVSIPTAQKTLGITRRVHTAEHAASAMFHLGVPVADVPRARMSAAPGRSPLAPAGSYAVIHAVAATQEKTWPSASFMEVAQYLHHDCGLEPVFIGGPGDELGSFCRWRVVSNAPLGEVAQLVRDASIFVGNDSGPAHVAAAFGIPQVVIFGPSDSEIWAPWKTRAEVLKADGLISSVTTGEVIAAIGRLL
jgi:heptosyltransferase-3